MSPKYFAAAVIVGASFLHPYGSFAQTAGDAPPMGGGYANPVPIPVEDSDVKNIAGALLKPAGAGPFPAVVYMSGCAGFAAPNEKPHQQKIVDRLLSKGVAVLVVDPFTARREEGVCARLGEHPELVARGARDARAAVNFLKQQPAIDPNRIILQGYSYGAMSVLLATDPNAPVSKGVNVAGVVAYYPYCRGNGAFGAPTLVLIGENDDWTPAKLCEAVRDKANVEVVVYPGVTHAFDMPAKQPIEFLGHRFVYDADATDDAMNRAESFMDARFRAK